MDKVLRTYCPLQLRETGTDSRKRQFVISTESKDRHGTVIPLSAWNLDNYNRNGIVAWSHETSGSFMGTPLDPDNILGSGRAWKEDGVLMGEVDFETKETNALADKILRKIDAGTLRAASVGFAARAGHWGKRADDEDPDTFYFDDVDLMEFSIVPIPSNPEAVIARDLSEYAKAFPKEGEGLTVEFAEPETQTKENPMSIYEARLSLMRATLR